MADIERLRKRLFNRRERVYADLRKQSRDTRKLFLEIEERGKLIDTLATENEQLKGDSEMLIAMLEVDHSAFIAITEQLDEHPEGYERACLCATCRSYA